MNQLGGLALRFYTGLKKISTCAVGHKGHQPVDEVDISGHSGRALLGLF